MQSELHIIFVDFVRRKNQRRVNVNQEYRGQEFHAVVSRKIDSLIRTTFLMCLLRWRVSGNPHVCGYSCPENDATKAHDQSSCVWLNVDRIFPSLTKVTWAETRR